MMDFIMKMGCGIHIPSRERETVARFDDIFDLCSLVRLRFICQIWHIFTSIWAMYPISLGYKLIFDSPQSDWLPIRWIYSNSPSSLSPSSIFAQQFYQLFSFKTFASSSQSCNSLERAPLSQRSRTKLSWFTSCECTLAPVRLYSAGLPSAGPNNRFPGRRDSLFWSRVLKCGLGNSQKLTWAGVSGYLWRAWHSLVCCPVSNSQHCSLSATRHSGLSRLARAFYYRLLLREKEPKYVHLLHSGLSTSLWWRADEIFRQNVSHPGKINLDEFWLDILLTNWFPASHMKSILIISDQILRILRWMNLVESQNWKMFLTLSCVLGPGSWDGS